VNVRELAESDLKDTMEDPNVLGDQFTLIDPDNNEYSVVGIVGDIGLLIAPESGERVRSRSVVCSCRIKTLAEQTVKIPCRGWKARISDLRGNIINAFIAGCDADRTIGIYNMVIALDLEATDE
jgi:hypothetical protein